MTLSSTGECIGIRTHRFGQEEAALCDELTRVFGPDSVFLIVDEITQANVVVPSQYNKICLTKDFLEKEGLLSIVPRLGWRCGDYFLYALFRSISRDRYWLIERDVAFTVGGAETLFGHCRNVNHDLIAYGFSEASTNWPWHAAAKTVSDTPYKCFFPLVRVSHRGLEYALARRVELSQQFQLNGWPGKNWPNDEGFIATVLGDSGYECIDLRCICPMDYSYFTANKAISRNFLSTAPPRLMLHPVLLGNDLTEKVHKIVSNALTKSTLSELLQGISETCSPNERSDLLDQVIRVMGKWAKSKIDPDTHSNK